MSVPKFERTLGLRQRINACATSAASSAAKREMSDAKYIRETLEEALLYAVQLEKDEEVAKRLDHTIRQCQHMIESAYHRLKESQQSLAATQLLPDSSRKSEEILRHVRGAAEAESELLYRAKQLGEAHADCFFLHRKFDPRDTKVGPDV